MNEIKLQFDSNSFSKFFPYFILIDENLKLISWGRSLKKVIPEITLGDDFINHFSVTRPKLTNLDSQNFNLVLDQLIIIFNTTNNLSIRGQFEKHGSSFVFVGSPWFSSMEEVVKRQLTLHDFAFHDPLLDLLHILKNQDINNAELKELLDTVNNQRKKLKKDKEDLNRLSLVASSNRNGVIFTNPDGTIFWCNYAYIELTGYTFDEIKGKTPIEIGKNELSSREEINNMIASFYKGEPFDVEILHSKKDNSTFWSRSKGQPILDSDGEVIQYFAIIEDITQEKLAEEKLLVLSSIAEKNINSVVISDKEGKIEWVNSSFMKMTGYELDELIGKKPGKFLQGPDTDKETIAYLSNQIKNGLPFNCEICNYNKKGQKYWVRIKGQALSNKRGDIIKYFAVEEDITQEKEFSQQLIESENRLTSLIVNLQSGVLLVDQNNKIVIVNKKFCTMFSILETPQSLKGKDLNSITKQIKPLFSNSKKFTDSTNELLKNHTEEIAEELKLVDGRVIERSFIPIIKDENFSGHLWSYEDITIKKRYKESLESEKEKYSNIIANMNMGLLEVDNDDNILLANNSFCEMSGYSLLDLLGKKAAELLLSPDSKKVVKSKNKERINKNSDSYEVTAKSKEGKIKHWLISGAPNYNVNGEVIGSIGVHLDITAQKKLEIQKEQLLKKLEKQNEQLNEYAQIVSHDLKSPLRSIHSLISWIKEDNDKEFSQETLQYLDMIEVKIEKMDHLIHGILTYSKIDDEKKYKENIDINTIVNDIIQIIHLPSHIELDILKKLPIIKADKFRMQQLFQNIIGNAVNYIDKPLGSIKIDYTKEKGYYIFSIKDNGPGIAEEYQDKIFKIFQSFTTSERSTGIGLSIVKRIVDNYKGNIWLESELTKGTTFFIKLPKK